MTKASGTFKVTAWDEHPYEHLKDGAKLTRAVVEQEFSGAIAGDGAVQWLMAYRPDGTAHFVGLQRITGSVGARSGTFLLETNGEFDGNEAKGTWTVVSDSASGDLEGLRGHGTFVAPHGSSATFELEYRFP